MLGSQNAQVFIRALKASSDPPQPSGPSKIDIARQAWDHTSLYVPNKAEVILDWLLSRLLKDKSRERSENPGCDTRYWKLMSDILFHSNHAKGDVHHSHTSRAWLVPLLNRIPIAPILLSYLRVLSAGHIDSDQYKLVTRCISVLWPLAVPKFNPETLLECFGAVIQLIVSPAVSDVSCGRLQALDDHRMLSAIVSSYRASLTHSTAKKKYLYSLFLKKYLPCWLRATSWSCEGEGVSAFPVPDIYDAGIETIFGLDILKQGTDHDHDTALTEALEASLNEHPEVVLRTLPRLLTSYVQNVKRHRNTLFSSGSHQAPGHTAEAFQRLTMNFYATCVSLARVVTDDSSWECRASLLGVVDRETLLSHNDEDAKTVLRSDGDMAVEALAAALDENHTQRTRSAVDILATLTQIDYDLISASFSVVFPRLAVIPPKVSSALPFLTLLLEYDSKTRNLPSTILRISDAFSVHHLERIHGGPAASYKIVSAGPLTSLLFQDALSRAVRNFLTPGQVLDTVRDVSRSLQEAYERFSEREAKLCADRRGPKKKRKKDAPPPENRSESEYHAVSFVLMARVLVVVLRSLPLHTVVEDVRSDAEGLIYELHSAVARRATENGLGAKEKRGLRSWQFAVIGALGLHYCLVRAPGMKLQLQLPLGHDLASMMLACMSTENTMPEMVVEMLRTLLLQCSLGALEPEATITGMLDYLGANLVDNNIAWNGKVHCLDTHASGAVAVLHLLADRWLPYVDEWATKAQSERLVTILIDATRDKCQPQSQLSMSRRDVVNKLMHNAEFWELPKIREAFLAHLYEQTASLAQIDLRSLLSRFSATSPVARAGDVVKLTSIYDVLLLTPPEYLPRSVHVEYVKRGFAADAILLWTLRYAKKAQVSEHHLVVIRQVLRRSIAHLGTVDLHDGQHYISYLLEYASGDSMNEALLSTTKHLIGMCQGSLLRSAKKGNAEVVISLVRQYAEAYLDEVPTIAKEASLLLVDSLVQTASVADFSVECGDCLRELYRRMLDYSLPRLEDSGTSFDRRLLDVWSHLRILGRWLEVMDDDVLTVGRQLSRKLLTCVGKEQDAIGLAPIVFSILLGELRDSGATDHPEQIEYVAAAYLRFSRMCDRDGLADLETRLAGACRTLPARTFTILWDLVRDGLPLHRGLTPEDVASLVRFSAIALCDAPEGTSRICQANMTRCLDLFADDERFTSSPGLRREVLSFLVRQCNDRPASLRTVDLSSLWSLLRAILVGYPEHEYATDITVFHDVVNVLSALVRLRRDLVLNTLPHLGFVLRQLVSCLVSPRSQLGGKQSRLVMDKLPRWISATQPLSALESKALARLLTTLMVKTQVRGHETKKAESLVRPFSKHAAYVLTAYVEAVNDPLCVVSTGVRKELQPGLFALCDMLGEHNRDAMMVSALDAGGKATMKTLWREYEKQRYIGKG